MKKFLEEYGFVILSVIIVVLIITFITPISNTVQNSTTFIVDSFQEKFSNTLDKIVDKIPSNTIIKINNEKYVILENKSKENYLVMKLQPIGKFAFNNSEYNNQNNSTCYHNSNNNFNHKGCSNIYENSSIDKYLNEMYYESLSFKDAIVKTDITQSFYKQTFKNDKFKWNDNIKTWEILENGTWVVWTKYTPIKGERGGFSFVKTGDKNNKGERSKKIQRNVFLPSVDEISKIINIDDQYQVEKIVKSDKNLNDKTSFLLRDGDVMARASLTIHSGSLSLQAGFLKESWMDIRPTFVINLSKVDFVDTGELFVN